MVLVTGFEPFGGFTHNLSAALLSLLPREVGGKVLHKAVLPVDTEALPQALAALHVLRRPLLEIL